MLDFAMFVPTAHNAPEAVPLLLWPWSIAPWQRIHVDYAKMKGQGFLLVVDSLLNG